jgi:hypothetical protein
MKPLVVVLAAIVLATSTACAQWDIQDSGTKASLRGIHSLGKGIAWASGTDGTVIRTEDGGFLWQHCTTPPGAEKLDFRGVQAFDENTAIVMSSGKGDLSRIYKTTDGCQTWKLVFTNPDKDGFWDALFLIPDFNEIFVLGDPVNGRFRLFSALIDEPSGILTKFSDDWNGHPLSASPGQSAFAASNSLFVENVDDGLFSFITGGAKSEVIHEEHGLDPKKGAFSEWSRSPLPFMPGESSGAFSIASAPYDKKTKSKHVVVVGGDYQHPDLATGTAAESRDWGAHFVLAETFPHGYRSAVTYDASTKTWITVGPNGTDVSVDDGRNWRALKPGPSEAADADKNWNALSLPFVVGPKGRVGVLRPAALASR